MILEFAIFLLELIVGIAYPLLMTVKLTVLSSPEYHSQFKSWVFYWIVFILLQNLSWTLDFFIWNLLKSLLLVALAMPQFQLSLRASNFILGPLQEIVFEQYFKFKDQLRGKVA